MQQDARVHSRQVPTVMCVGLGYKKNETDLDYCAATHAGPACCCLETEEPPSPRFGSQV